MVATYDADLKKAVYVSQICSLFWSEQGRSCSTEQYRAHRQVQIYFQPSTLYKHGLNEMISSPLALSGGVLCTYCQVTTKGGGGFTPEMRSLRGQEPFPRQRAKRSKVLPRWKRRDASLDTSTLWGQEPYKLSLRRKLDTKALASPEPSQSQYRLQSQPPRHQLEHHLLHIRFPHNAVSGQAADLRIRCKSSLAADLCPSRAASQCRHEDGPHHLRHAPVHAYRLQALLGSCASEQHPCHSSPRP